MVGRVDDLSEDGLIAVIMGIMLGNANQRSNNTVPSL